MAHPAGGFPVAARLVSGIRLLPAAAARKHSGDGFDLLRNFPAPPKQGMKLGNGAEDTMTAMQSMRCCACTVFLTARMLRHLPVAPGDLQGPGARSARAAASGQCAGVCRDPALWLPRGITAQEHEIFAGAAPQLLICGIQAARTGETFLDDRLASLEQKDPSRFQRISQRFHAPSASAGRKQVSPPHSPRGRRDSLPVSRQVPMVPGCCRTCGRGDRGRSPTWAKRGAGGQVGRAAESATCPRCSSSAAGYLSAASAFGIRRWGRQRRPTAEAWARSRGCIASLG